MLINLRNALMSGKRLPYDAEVEFLESTGTQYIDTGVPLYSDMQITASLGGVTFVSDSVLFGSNVSSSRNAGQFSVGAFVYNASQIFSSNYNRTTSGIQGAVFGDGDHEIKKMANETYYDGVLKLQPTAVSRYYAGGNCFIFWGGGFHEGAFANKAVAKFKSFLVCDSSGRPLFDGIPVRVGQVGYLYDRVSGKLFGNAGTGDFVLGPDVVPVEYIESHGTEYIDTGMSVDDSIGYAVDFEYQQTNTWLLGGRSSASASQNNAWMPNDSTLRVAYGSATKDITTTKVRHVLSMIGGVVKLDGATSHTFPTQTFAATSKFLIFNMAYNSGGAPANSPLMGRIYSCEIFKGNATALRPIPVRVGTEGAMMDVLTRRIYRNKGTGAFTYGNDLKYPIPA